MSRCPHCGEAHGSDNHFCPIMGKPIDLGPRLIGQIILERYKIITILGEGPTGIVLEVEETRTREKLAAKLIHPQFIHSEDAAERLLSEAKKAGTLDCENIAKVYNVGRDAGAAPTVVRDLMIGQCLEDYIEDNGQLPLGEVMFITRAILNALSAIHEVQILNLDLSPADVFLDSSSGTTVVKLVDFGEGHIKSGLKQDGGEDPESYNYHAPEQRRKKWVGDPRTDIFAAGAVMYHMLTGQPPAKIPEPVLSFRNDVDSDLAAVVNKALASAPDNRYQSASDFILALSKAQGTSEAKVPLLSQEPVYVPDHTQTQEPEQKPEPEPEIENYAYFDKPTGSDRELEQPSVIVDMPEVAKVAARNKTLKIAGLVAGLAVIVVIWLMSSGGADEILETVAPIVEKVTITIQATPPNAAVIVDGKRVKGNPPKLIVESSDELVTIKAKADGFEPLEKDVKFNATKTITLELMEIIAPSGDEPDDNKEQPEIEEITDEVDQAEGSGKAQKIIAPTPVEKPKVKRTVKIEKPRPKKKIKPRKKTNPPQKAPPKRKAKPKKKKQKSIYSNPYG